MGLGAREGSEFLCVIQTGIGILVFVLCTFIVWSLSIRFFASWSEVCFNIGPGWNIGLIDLLGRSRWNSDLMVSSVAPFLPYLFFIGPRQTKTRQAIMICAMLCTAAALYLLAGPVDPTVCDSKGPFPEIGFVFVGVVVSLPLAFGLAWVTRSVHKPPQD